MKNLKLHQPVVVSAVVVPVCLIVAGFVLLMTVTLPSDNLTHTSLQNSGHFVLFALLGYAVLQQFLKILEPDIVKSVLLSAVCLIAMGLVVELLQAGMISRSASKADFMLDIAGISAGFTLYLVIRLAGKGKVLLALLISCVVIPASVVVLAPTLYLFGFDLFRAQLPTVRDFHHPFSLAKIESQGAAEFERVTGKFVSEYGETENYQALRVGFNTALYSGVIFHESPANWSDYTGLRLKIFNSMQSVRHIELRINDSLHNNLYEDRYNTALSVEPGMNLVEVPLELIENMGSGGDAKRVMDINAVSRIQLFTSGSEESFSVDVVLVELF